MSTKLKDGKIVIDQSTEAYFESVMASKPFATKHGSRLYEVPPAIKKEIEQAGYEMRFINEAQYKAASNSHKRYWVPYNANTFSGAVSDTSKSGIGLSPDGYLRRKTDVLAIRPKRLGDEHRAMIREKNEAQAAFAQTESFRFKEQAARAGFQTEDVD